MKASIAFGLMLALLGAGCERPDGREEELAAATNRIVELEAQMAQALATHTQEVQQLRDNARVERQEYVNTIRQLRDEVKSKVGLVEKLEKENAMIRGELAALKEKDLAPPLPVAPPPPPAPVAPPPRPEVPVAAGFPLKVSDVRVDQVVEGVRVQQVPDPAGGGGTGVKVNRVTEYGYLVHFTLNNPSRERKTVSVSAGKSTALLAVPAFGVTASSISAERDQPLRMNADGQTTEIPVSYPPAAP